ncbi:MAG: ABC transporter substrate-binding protein [Gallionella sp.]|nr:ABC transporter substrate-binding protein [Gallionella sp.]MDD4960479.1 ABC transporter substrate-binding protein [Gallionella sp.]
MTRIWMRGWVVLFCLSAHTAFAQTAVVMQLRWQHQFQFAGYYAALRNGYYKDAGLDVTLKEGGLNISTVEEVLQGRAQFGVSNAGLVKAFLNDQPVLMLAPIIQHSPQILLSLGQLSNPADIAKAGAIGLQPGDESVDLKAIFINEGIALNKLNIVSKGGLEDLVAGRIVAMNGYLSNEPFWLKSHGIAYHIIKPEHYGMDFYSDVLFTHQSMEKNHPDVVASFRAATLKGWEYALSHQEEIIDLILTRYNTQGKTREQLSFEANTIDDLVSPSLIQIGYSNPHRWQHIANTFARFDFVVKDKSLDGFFYQPNKSKDFATLSYKFGSALILILLVSGIFLYIYFINSRLKRTAKSQLLGEELLRKSEMRYRVFFETAPFVGVVWREGYIITDWNHRAEEVFGFKRHEVLGRNYLEFLIPETEKQILEPKLVVMMQDNSRPHAINHNLTRDGQLLTIEWFNAWLPKSTEQPQEVLSFGLDITERCKSDARLKQVLVELEKSESDQRMLLSVASHEFRTPAAMIKTSLDSLGFLKHQISPDVALRLENISKASLRLNRLANNLISFDRVHEHALKPKKQMLDLAMLAKGVIAKYPKDVNLQLNLPEYALLYEGDGILLRIALHNLIDNAIRYHLSEEVPIVVSLETVHDTVNRWIEIRVADQGKGVADAKKDVIFQRFYSTKGSQSDGLGLSIVRSIAQSHGGTAFALDNEPQGVIMVIKLCFDVSEGH